MAIRMQLTKQAPSVPLIAHTMDTFGMAAERSQELFRDILDGTFHIEGRAAPDRGRRFKSRIWFLDDLALADVKAEEHVINRTLDLARRNPTPVVKVRIYRSGHSLLVHGDEQIRLGPGAIHFIDHDRPGRHISSDHEQLTLAVPHNLLGYDPSVHPATFSIGIDTPRGRLLKTGLDIALEGAKGGNQSDAVGLAEALSGLLQGIMAGGVDSEQDGPTRRTRIAAMKAFIDKNLAVQELGIDMLLQAFGASRATIYRDFAEDGGLQKFILTRRLQRAYRLLSEAAPSRGAVQDAAVRSGFIGLAHFSRSFRDHFGERPSDIMGQWNGLDDLMELAGGNIASRSSPYTDAVAAMRWAYERFS